MNLVDFDMVYGHRNDVLGFLRALRELDNWLPELEAALRPGDAVFITADHGNDPTTPGTDHTREHVPLLAFGPGIRPARLGTRTTFCDLGQTIADGLGVAPLAAGEASSPPWSVAAAARREADGGAAARDAAADRAQARRRRAGRWRHPRRHRGRGRRDDPDYQLSALLMAIVCRGMTARELHTWTVAMIDSGDRLRWPAPGGAPSTSTRPAA